MVLGMSLATFTLVHVVISLIAIVAGILVMIGMLGGQKLPSFTAIFLVFTILTSTTGFLFPVTQLMPSHVIGIISLLSLALACIALYGQKLVGTWRSIYVVTALLSLYLNVFVLVVQGFLKISALSAIAPGNPPTGPVFAAVQGVVLVVFAASIFVAWRRFWPKTAAT
jgi:hypothetical protein